MKTLRIFREFGKRKEKKRMGLSRKFANTHSKKSPGGIFCAPRNPANFCHPACHQDVQWVYESSTWPLRPIDP